MYQRFSFIR